MLFWQLGLMAEDPRSVYIFAASMQTQAANRAMMALYECCLLHTSHDVLLCAFRLNTQLCQQGERATACKRS